MAAVFDFIKFFIKMTKCPEEKIQAFCFRRRIISLLFRRLQIGR